MQRWEYRVVSWPKGQYTARLNEYGRDGWELLAVVPDDPDGPVSEPGPGLPMPRSVGRLQDAATRWNKLGDSQSAPATSSLLWVLRRPIED